MTPLDNPNKSIHPHLTYIQGTFTVHLCRGQTHGPSWVGRGRRRSCYTCFRLRIIKKWHRLPGWSFKKSHCSEIHVSKMCQRTQQTWHKLVTRASAPGFDTAVLTGFSCDRTTDEVRNFQDILETYLKSTVWNVRKYQYYPVCLGIYWILSTVYSLQLYISLCACMCLILPIHDCSWPTDIIQAWQETAELVEKQLRWKRLAARQSPASSENTMSRVTSATCGDARRHHFFAQTNKNTSRLDWYNGFFKKTSYRHFLQMTDKSWAASKLSWWKKTYNGHEN